MDNNSGDTQSMRQRLSIEERKQYILTLLDQRGSVTVSELSEYFGISEVSIRKLLIALEKEFLLQRTWGGAIKPIGTMKELSYQARETTHLAEKMSIAQAAYDCINDGDSIYVDSGTTTFELIKQLKTVATKNILVATNALDHAVELIGQANINLVFIGGEVRYDSRSCSGYITKDTISQMVFDKCFIGVEHISISHGITTPNMREAELKRSIIQSSKQAFILADHSKFWNDSFIQIVPTEKCFRVITDWHIAQEEIDQFQSKGVHIIASSQPSDLVTGHLSKP